MFSPKFLAFLGLTLGYRLYYKGGNCKARFSLDYKYIFAQESRSSPKIGDQVCVRDRKKAMIYSFPNNGLFALPT